MENEDEQKHNANDAGTPTNCDTNVHTNTQNEVHNRYVVRIYSKYMTKQHFILMINVSHYVMKVTLYML